VAQVAAELKCRKTYADHHSDGTATMPMPLMFRLLQQEIGTHAAACDYLVLWAHRLAGSYQVTACREVPSMIKYMSLPHSRLMTGCPIIARECRIGHQRMCPQATR